MIYSVQGVSSVAEPLLIVQLGDIETLPLNSEDRVRVYNKQILTAHVADSKLVISGKKIGLTFVQIGRLKYKILVCNHQLKSTFHKIDYWIRDKRGPKIEVNSREIELGGMLLTLTDLRNLQSIMGEQSLFINRMQISSSLKIPIQEFINQQILTKGLPLGRMEFAPKWMYNVPTITDDQKALYQLTLAPLGIGLNENQDLLSQRPLVQIQLYICQVSQRFFRHYGLQWPSVATGQIMGNNQQIDLNFSAEFSIHALEQQGLGKVLASPTLTTQSHEKANFHSGGEFPIMPSRSLFSQVQWKKHGIILEVEPRVDQQRAMQIKINAEISLLDHGQSVNGIPAIDKSQLQSTFYLPYTQPLVLSGLVKQNWSKQREGLPLLSQIPILNNFFAHKEYLDSRSDIVFIVVPKIL